jgi:hypothetical protein
VNGIDGLPTVHNEDCVQVRTKAESEKSPKAGSGIPILVKAGWSCDRTWILPNVREPDHEPIFQSCGDFHLLDWDSTLTEI